MGMRRFDILRLDKTASRVIHLTNKQTTTDNSVELLAA